VFLALVYLAIFTCSPFSLLQLSTRAVCDTAILVFLLEVEFICLFASFNYMSNNVNEEAGRTSTCEVLLSVRSTALKPDQSTRQRIVLLGCVGRRRGCREGRAKKKHKHFSDTGRKFLLSLRVTTSYIRPYTEILARFVVQSYVR